MLVNKIDTSAVSVTGELWNLKAGDQVSAAVALWSEPSDQLALLYQEGAPGLSLPLVEHVPILLTFDRCYATDYLAHVLKDLVEDLRLPESQIDTVSGLLAPPKRSRQEHHHIRMGMLPSGERQVGLLYRIALRGKPQIPNGTWRSLAEAQYYLAASESDTQQTLARPLLRRLAALSLKQAARAEGLQTQKSPSYSLLQQRGIKDGQHQQLRSRRLLW